MTQVKQGSSLLKELQDKIGKQLDERESAIKNYSPSPIKCSSSKQISEKNLRLKIYS